ncbi:DNA-3-methyladenine glycosylase [Intestinimonas butyriciproducens]|uniref:DNA-3-methyladenine glycosylase n=1 Tax=Intestinimonas butyriciproducens TaxID=1297617 RepID=UPI0034A47780
MVHTARRKVVAVPKLTRDFYERDTLLVARDLLGKYLVHRVDGVPLCGRITETEAYIGRMDKACHAYGYKRTPRTQTLFSPPGTAYLYLIYGMYHCLNFVTEPEGEPCAVLLRAVEAAEAAEGAEFMAQNRFGCGLSALTPYQRKNFLNGPGKVCRAFSLTRAQNGLDLTGDTLFLWDAGETPEQIHVGKRIGIDYAEEAADFPWRFYL